MGLNVVLMPALLFIVTTDIVLCSNYSNSNLLVSLDYEKCRISGEKLSSSIDYLLKKNLHSDTVFLMLILPALNEHFPLLELLENTVKKLISFWSIVIIDSYCCDNASVPALNFDTRIHNKHTASVYMIHLQETNTTSRIGAQMFVLKDSKEFNPGAMFILYMFTNRCGTYPENKVIRTVFNWFWYYNCLSVTILILSRCDFEVTVISGKPFSGKNCRTIERGRCQIQRLTTKSVEDVEFFVNRVTDFNGCPFRMGTLHTPPYSFGVIRQINNSVVSDFPAGIDISLVQTFSRKYNFTYTFRKPFTYEPEGWFTMFPNGTVVGLMQDIITHSVDLIFGGLIPSYVVYYKYELSTAYKFSYLSIFVPEAKILPQWKIYGGAYSGEVWLWSTLVFALVVCVYYAVSVRDVSTHRGLEVCNLLRVWLTQASPLNPVSSPLRLVLVSWALFSLHWSLTYNSVLFDLIKNPPIGKEMTTINELNKSEMRLASIDLWLNVVKGFEVDNVTRFIVEHRSFVCENFELCVKGFVRYKNFSLMEKSETVRYHMNTNGHKVRELKENVYGFAVSMMSNRGNPLMFGLNEVLLRSSAGGLFHRWETGVEAYFKKYRQDYEVTDQPLPLTLRVLKGAFIFLIFGLITSLEVFLMEYFYYVYSSIFSDLKV